MYVKAFAFAKKKIFYDYLTSFYVKHFELPLCMKCAL